MTADFLAMVAGIILSLAFSYIPWFASRYDLLAPEYKRLVMLALLLFVALASIGLACVGVGVDFGLAVTCDRAGIVGVIQAFVFAAMANQSTYLLTKRPAHPGSDLFVE